MDLYPKCRNGFAHLGEDQASGLSPRLKRASLHPSFSPARGSGENFLRRHGMRAGLSGIAAEGAVSTVVAAEIGERQKNLTRIGDCASLKGLLRGTRRIEQRRQFIVNADYQSQGQVARDGGAGRARPQKTSQFLRPDVPCPQPAVLIAVFITISVRVHARRCNESYISNRSRRPGPGSVIM